MRKSILYILTIISLFSCDDELVLGIDEINAMIVVEGSIEQGGQAKVFLTRNAPYFGAVDSASIRELVLSRAKVEISDGERSEVLILRKDDRYFPPYHYAGNTIFGDTGKVYTIQASYGGKSVQAETSIPEKVAIDTAFLELNADSDSLGRIIFRFSDPADQKNYYSIYTKRLGRDKRFVPSFIMAIDDKYFNGEEMSITLSRTSRNILSTKEAKYFSAKDEIVVKLCTMDEATFHFWNGYQEEVLNTTNPFAASMLNLESNIEGDGLGVWGGYGVSLDTVRGLGK